MWHADAVRRPVDGPDAVHKADGLEEIAALALGKPGRFTLQRAHHRVAPQQNVQGIAQLAGLLKKAHVLGMEVIEGADDDHVSQLSHSGHPTSSLSLTLTRKAPATGFSETTYR